MSAISESSHGPAPAAAPDLLVRAAERLRAIGFTEAAVSGMITPTRPGVPPILSVGTVSDELGVATRLFIAGESVAEPAVRAALGPPDLEDWIAGGLLTAVDGRVHADRRIAAVGSFLILSDHEHRGTMREDHVVGVGGSTRTLLDVLVPVGPARVLELGTGSGFVAMTLGTSGARVVATDLNPRAVRAANDNAAMNGLADAVEVRSGDRFEPVAGETFDLIVANPPFVISPETTYAFRDSPERGDRFCRSIIRGAPEHLDEGGWLQLLVSWPHVAGRAWEADLREWFEGLPLDAWVLRLESLTPQAYASTWLGQTEHVDLATYGPRMAAWLTAYADAGFEGLSGGVVTARKRSNGPNTIVFHEPPDDVNPGAGAHILSVFAAMEAGTMTDVELLGRVLTLDPDLRITQRLTAGPDGGWRIVSATLDRATGINWTGGIDAAGVHLLGALDGMRTLGEALDDLAQQEQVELASVLDRWLSPVRALVARGYLRLA